MKVIKGNVTEHIYFSYVNTLHAHVHIDRFAKCGLFTPVSNWRCFDCILNLGTSVVRELVGRLEEGGVVGGGKLPACLKEYMTSQVIYRWL